MDKIGYIPKDQRKKILLISDDLRAFSGCGRIAKETANEKIKQIKLNSTEQALRIAAQKKGIQLTDEQIKKTAQDINLAVQGNMRAWDQLKQSERDAVRKAAEDAGGGQGIMDLIKLLF